MAFVGLVPSEHSSGEQRRQGSITKVGNSHVRRLLVESAWHARRRPKVGYELARRQRGQDATVSSAPGAASNASTSAGSGWPAAASQARRSSSPAPANSPASSGRSPPTNPSGTDLTHQPASRPGAADAPDHTENPRELYAAPTPATRDLRPRQLPTVTSHAVPTGECQSDPPSLHRAIRCSRPRGQPTSRAAPLDVLLHVRTRIEMKGPLA